MVENDSILIVWHLRVGSAGHGPANIGEVCGIHVSYPANGGSRSNPQESFSDVSIRWRTPTLTPYIDPVKREAEGKKSADSTSFLPGGYVYGSTTVGERRRGDDLRRKMRMRTREKQMMKKFEVDRGWDSWDSDRRRKLVAVMIYHGQMTARDTKNQHSREMFWAPVFSRIRGGYVCVGRYACAWERP